MSEQHPLDEAFERISAQEGQIFDEEAVVAAIVQSSNTLYGMAQASINDSAIDRRVILLDRSEKSDDPDIYRLYNHKAGYILLSYPMHDGNRKNSRAVIYNPARDNSHQIGELAVMSGLLAEIITKAERGDIVFLAEDTE